MNDQEIVLQFLTRLWPALGAQWADIEQEVYQRSQLDNLKSKLRRGNVLK